MGAKREGGRRGGGGSTLRAWSMTRSFLARDSLSFFTCSMLRPTSIPASSSSRRASLSSHTCHTRQGTDEEDPHQERRQCLSTIYKHAGCHPHQHLAISKVHSQPGFLSGNAKLPACEKHEPRACVCMTLSIQKSRKSKVDCL